MHVNLACLSGLASVKQNSQPEEIKILFAEVHGKCGHNFEKSFSVNGHILFTIITQKYRERMTLTYWCLKVVVVSPEVQPFQEILSHILRPEI